MRCVCVIGMAVFLEHYQTAIPVLHCAAPVVRRSDSKTIRPVQRLPPPSPPRGCSCTGRCISVPRRLCSQYVVLVAFPCACPQILSCRAALRDTPVLSVAAPAIAYFVTGGINVSCKTFRPLYVGGHLWCCSTY